MVVKIDLSSFPGPLKRDASRRIVVEPVAAHIVGSMREVWAEDVQRRPFRLEGASVDLGGYLPGDRIGEGGVEEAAERILRGKRGQVLIHRDTGRKDRVLAVPGDDVHLTLDIQLQARVQAIMDPALGLMRVQPWHDNERMALGTPLYGAAVVIDVDTGGILAMVSTPNMEELPEDASDILRYRAAINSVLSAPYPPGSTVKPLVYTLAVRAGVVELGEKINCQGHLFPNKPTSFRCWIYKGYGMVHGPLGPAEAIARSCNIYFYTCGRRMGPVTLVRGYRDFGFGQRIHLGLSGGIEGMLPTVEQAKDLRRNEATFMGIGQGKIAVPPIQVAAAHAALARGGYYLSPVLIEEFADKQVSRNLMLPPRAVTQALKGMYLSANARYGSGSYLRFEDGSTEKILTLPGVTLRAKTGTADAPARFKDLNDNGELDEGEPILRAGDHSWFVCHAQRKGEERAAYVIVVMVEYGGSGGRVSGPVTNQILYALRAEGYL